MSLQNLNDQLETMASAVLDTTGVTHARLAESVTNDNDIPAGACGWQIASVIAARAGDSNVSKFNAEARVRLHYSWQTSAAQQVWLETHLDAVLRELVDPSKWRALAAVHEVVTLPEVTFPEAVGRVVTVEVVALVALD